MAFRHKAQNKIFLKIQHTRSNPKESPTEREGFALLLQTSCLKPPGPGVFAGAQHRAVLPVLSNRAHTRSNPKESPTEREGFEPSELTSSSTAFEAARFNHSRISPNGKPYNHILLYSGRIRLLLTRFEFSNTMKELRSLPLNILLYPRGFEPPTFRSAT